MIRIRVHPAIAFGLLVLIGGLILVGVLPGGPGGTPPTVPAVVVPTRPTLPGQQQYPDGITAAEGDVPGEPIRVAVDANANASEGDIQVIYDGATDPDGRPRFAMRVSSDTEPGGQLRLSAGDRFAFAGYVFMVDDESNAWRLVLDVWPPA